MSLLSRSRSGAASRRTRGIAFAIGATVALSLGATPRTALSEETRALTAQTTGSSTRRLRKRYRRALERAERAVQELSINATIRNFPDGPMAGLASLRTAYHQRRALGLRGTHSQIRTWMALAMYGALDARDRTRAGPLRNYDLVVVTGHGDSAWLHLIVPRDGKVSTRRKGRHVALVNGELWMPLSGLLEPGDEYLPFKRNGNPALHRQWGKINVIRDVARIARAYLEQTGIRLGIGDVSHVTGGPMSDHMTHRVGADVDFYILTFDPETRGDEGAQISWHQHTRGGGFWSTEPDGTGLIEEPDPDTGRTPSELRLVVLAGLALDNEDIAYFVHDAVDALEPFDLAAGRRRPGKRFLHAKNRGFWPPHRDHVHMRWVAGPLPTSGPPRP